MSLSNLVITGKQVNPRRVMVVGVPGIGKSTFASKAEGVVFLDLEGGVDDLDVAKTPKATSLAQVKEFIELLLSEEHAYKALAIDTADWLERLIWDQLCKETQAVNIAEAYGGFGKGFVMASKVFKLLLDSLDRLRSEKGMTIILLAHAKTERFNDPDHEPYDRYVPKLHSQVREILVEWCDEVLFANYKTLTKTTDLGFNKTATKGLGTGERILRTTAKPSAVAKNRLDMPDEIKFDFDVFNSYVTK